MRARGDDGSELLCLEVDFELVMPSRVLEMRSEREQRIG